MSNPKTKTYNVINGKSDTLLTAPHAHSHLRQSLTKSYKSGEPWTDVMVDSLCEATNSWGLVVNADQDIDPNYFEEEKNPFKKEIRKIIEENKIKYVFDFHGLNDVHQYDIAIYYSSRFHKSKKLAYIFAEALNSGELRGASIHIRNFVKDQQETIGEFAVQNFDVGALQFEVARYIREDSALRGEFIKTISDVIVSLA